jgi:hypothetical protein
MDEQLAASPCSEATTSKEEVWIVKAVENVTVPPRCQQIIVRQLDSDKNQNPPPLVCIEPAKIPIEDILPAHGLSRVMTMANEPPRVTSSHSNNMTRTRNSQLVVMVAKFSDEQLIIPKAIFRGVVEEITEELVDRIKQTDYPISDPLNDRGKRERSFCTRNWCMVSYTICP